MNKIICLALLLFFLEDGTRAQILCIMCYDQNDSISSGVNNLIVNGSFENSNCQSGYILDVFCPNSNYYSCDLDNWTCTGGGSSTYVCVFDSLPGSRSTLIDGNYAVYMGNYFCAPCNAVTGDTSCFTMADCELSGIPAGFPTHSPDYGGNVGVSIEQTVNGLMPGNTYVLEFWAGGENNASYFTDPGMFGVDVGFGNTLLRCHQTPYGTGIGTRFIIEFNAVSASHNVKFTSWGHVCSSCTELVLDQVRLYSIAELNPSIPPCAGSTIAALFNAPNHICPGTCTDFTNLSINANSFLWSFPGATPSISTDVNPANICYNSPGSYPVTLIAGNGITTDTLTLNNFITVYAYPPPQGISQIGDTLFANPGAVSYQWYYAGNSIPGATNSYFIALQSGDYNVVATGPNGCEVEAVIYNVIASLAVPPELQQVSLSPNPARDNIQVLGLPAERVAIRIYNLLGEIVHQTSTTASDSKIIEISDLAPSGYRVEVQGGKTLKRILFIKE